MSKSLAGSQSINPLPEKEEVEEKIEQVEPQEEEAKEPEQEESKVDPRDEKISLLEKQLSDSQQMIGRQSSEVSELRQAIDNLSSSQKQEQTPDQAAEIDSIAELIDDGELSLKEGLARIREIDRSLTAASVMQEMTKLGEQQKQQETLNNWHKENPGFQTALDSGALKPYLEADPMADEYSAYKDYLADEKIKTLEEQHAAALKEAEEKGARLAQGAEKAGQVAGKTGSTAQQAANAPPRKFKNDKEAAAALTAKLDEIRSTAQ